jgi:hypothetical protein
MDNNISICTVNLKFSINSITAFNEANKAFFSKCTGEFSRQLLINESGLKSYSRKIEEIKKNENF